MTDPKPSKDKETPAHVSFPESATAADVLLALHEYGNKNTVRYRFRNGKMEPVTVKKLTLEDAKKKLEKKGPKIGYWCGVPIYADLTDLRRVDPTKYDARRTEGAMQRVANSMDERVYFPKGASGAQILRALYQCQYSLGNSGFKIQKFTLKDAERVFRKSKGGTIDYIRDRPIKTLLEPLKDGGWAADPAYYDRDAGEGAMQHVADQMKYGHLPREEFPKRLTREECKLFFNRYSNETRRLKAMAEIARKRGVEIADIDCLVKNMTPADRERLDYGIVPSYLSSHDGDAMDEDDGIMDEISRLGKEMEDADKSGDDEEVFASVAAFVNFLPKARECEERRYRIDELIRYIENERPVQCKPHGVQLYMQLLRYDVETGRVKIPFSPGVGWKTIESYVNEKAKENERRDA